MIDFPTAFTDNTQPLPADGLGDKGAQAVQQLAAQNYEVHIGLTKDFAQAISAMALEPNIREYCPKDSSQRFSDLQATEHWLTKGRAVFLLLKRSSTGDLALAGYGWAGPGSDAHVPGGKTTFALRIGEVGQGQGLATPFAWLIVAATAALYDARDIWLETWASNGAAVHIYQKLGAQPAAEESADRPLPDGGSVADKRLYMTVPNNLLPPALSR